MSARTVFTSESVTEGHPDKVADQISDTILDAVLSEDPHGRVACETLVTTGLCVVAGEITTTAHLDVPELARETIVDIGYDDDATGFNGRTCAVLVSLDRQSPEIAAGVDAAVEHRTGAGGEDARNAQGAGDQGMMFGYACDETEDLLPLPIWLAHRLSMRLAQVRRTGQLTYLRPDGKTQVSVAYEGARAVGIETIVVSAQHHDGISQDVIHDDLLAHVIDPVVPKDLDRSELVVHTNPSGAFDESPMTELYGRLVNLAVAPGFASVEPVTASKLGGQNYPDSLLYPDKHAIVPRLGLAWRPISGSSMVVRAGYGVYYNTSVYQNIATLMAEQTSVFSLQNTAALPLSLSNLNYSTPSSLPNFGIDPHFQIGYAQNWQASVQRDLPASLQMTATYLGIKGTRGMQEFFPNTYPLGGVNPCPTCPSGFTYMTSNGNSTRESGSVQLRRRLHNGFTSTLQYTLSKSIDDAALGGRGQATMLVAQNWLDLSAERGLSSFDQRQLLNFTAQYTSGMGISGGTLLNGWRGALFKEWTLSTTITAGSGLPLTPSYFAPTPGTGYTGYLRADATGAPVYTAPAGLLLNPAAFTAPAAGQWGNAGRDSIIGPAQFTLNGSLARTFRWGDRMNVDLRFDVTNALNHVTFIGLNTIVNSPQFGSPNAANQMRAVLTTLRWRF